VYGIEDERKRSAEIGELRLTEAKGLAYPWLYVSTSEEEKIAERSAEDPTKQRTMQAGQPSLHLPELEG